MSRATCQWILYAIATLIALPQAAAAPNDDDVVELKRRLQQLEQQVQILKDNQGAHAKSDAKAFDDSALDFEHEYRSRLQVSGYADVEIRSASEHSEHPRFRVHHFSVILTRQIDEHWRTFAEVEFEDAPRVEFTPESQECQGTCTGQIFLEAMNVDYSPWDYAGVQLGRFFTPAGIWSVDHYPPFVATQERPLHIRRIFPQLIDGALVHGVVPVGSVFIGYDTYVGNGNGGVSVGEMNRDKTTGLRATVQLPWLTKLEVGASVYTDTLRDGATSETSQYSNGFHVLARSGHLAFQAEAAGARYDPKGGSAYTTEGYYAQLAYDITAATTLGYRYDYFHDYDAETLSAVVSERNSWFANFRAQKNVVLKLEHHLGLRTGAIDDTLTIGSVVVYLGE